MANPHTDAIPYFTSLIDRDPNDSNAYIADYTSPIKLHTNDFFLTFVALPRSTPIRLARKQRPILKK